ncbi:Crp/Fnr family transcriptional regulator [Sedimentimonas flavescens]|uniref:Crp/Fnr family transcriptional regulator n=1 Tax=Sedimentimonas flavescens TaxID=2851012 RepID=UPI001C4A1663|nr:Crp/Fnr family transcriptional regulator [Sedimentimonas flavescens]MBW0157644.1 Crp/Fnr family transcriptional regulator [Sedimentimonas flavescens]MCT2541103.1 Crp/Fnr family transcriptional regulator [Sedimentimonas flavescens]
MDSLGSDERRRIIERLPLFEGLGAEIVAQIDERLLPRKWAPGSTIFQRGDAGDYMIIVTAGRVRLTLATPHGRELVLRDALPGECVGEMSVIDGEPRSSDCTTLQELCGLTLHRRDYLALCARHPDVPLAAARYLSLLLRETNDKLEALALYDLQARFARFLLAMLRQHHGTRIEAVAELPFDLTQGDIAAMLGASRPKVNRALNSLVAEGIVTRKEKLLICRVAELTEVAERDPVHGNG